MPDAHDIDHHPANGPRHRRPVGPSAVLKGDVVVEEEEGNGRSGGAAFGDATTAPGLEGGGGSGFLGRALLGGAGVVCEGGYVGNLVVEVG